MLKTLTAHQYLAFQVHNVDLLEVCFGCNIVGWLFEYLVSWFVGHVDLFVGWLLCEWLIVDRFVGSLNDRLYGW